MLILKMYYNAEAFYAFEYRVSKYNDLTIPLLHAFVFKMSLMFLDN